MWVFSYRFNMSIFYFFLFIAISSFLSAWYIDVNGIDMKVILRSKVYVKININKSNLKS